VNISEGIILNKLACLVLEVGEMLKNDGLNLLKLHLPTVEMLMVSLHFQSFDILEEQGKVVVNTEKLNEQKWHLMLLLRPCTVIRTIFSAAFLMVQLELESYFFTHTRQGRQCYSCCICRYCSNSVSRRLNCLLHVQGTSAIE
jgi:hypothetical protein